MTDPRGQQRWFTAPVPNPQASLRLFCLPYAGGGASVFVPWARASRDPRIEIRPVQLPGRETRLDETPFAAIEPLVAALANAIQPFVTSPYALFGHSMGATVAFELARELRRRGQPLPRHLFASGITAPDVPDQLEPLTGIEDDLEFVSKIAIRYGGLPEIVLENEELRALIVPALRADLTLHENYRYREETPLPVDTTAYGGDTDALVSEAALGGWARHTSAAFDYRFYNGGHFFLNTARDEMIADVTRHLMAKGTPARP